MSTIDQQFVEYIIKSLVGKPDAVKIERRVDEKGVLLELTVDPEDLGRVIGKRGATAQSLRTLLRALGTKNDARYNLKIIDNGFPRPERETDQEPQNHDAPRTEQPKTDEKSEPAEEQASEVSEETPPQTASKPSEDAWGSGNGTTDSSSDDSSTQSTSSVSDDLDLEDDDKAEDNSDKLSQTRKELDDLDDLDI